MCLEDHPASSELLDILWGQGKPRPALIRCLLSTRLGVGPVQGQGLKIQLFTLMEQSSAKGEAGRSEGPWNLGGGGNHE